MAEQVVSEVIVGTYEGILIGYYVVREENNIYRMKQSFSSTCHSGSIRCAAISDRNLASGSIDETIKLFNIKSRKEIGALFQHEGSINCLRFHNNSHMFSGSDDGSLCIWKPGSWQCLRTLRGHKDAITSLSIHPSGKIALTVSKDKTLKTWNLIKGRAAFTTNIKKVSTLVEWSPNGKKYAVVHNRHVDVYNVETAGIIHSIDFGRSVNVVVFMTDSVLIIGGEGENVEFHLATKKGILCVLPTKTNRIKALSCIPSPDDTSYLWLVTSSSNGFIKIWRVDPSNLDVLPELVTQEDSGCRITCHVVTRSTICGEAKEATEAEPEDNRDEQDDKDQTSDETDSNSTKRKSLSSSGGPKKKPK